MLYRSGQPVPSKGHACAGCGRPMPGDRIAIHDMRRGYRYVHASDVTMLRAMHKYVEVWSRAGLHGLVNDAIDRMAERYPHMLRVHRATLVDPHAVESIVRRTEVRDPSYQLRVTGVDGPVLVSRREGPAVQRRLRDRR